MTRLLRDYNVIMIWYICIYGLDVKDRLRGGNRPKIAHDQPRPYMARGCGAVVTLAIRYRFDIGLLSTLYRFENQPYFTNCTSFKLISTFTRLFNTYVNPCTLVRPM